MRVKEVGVEVVQEVEVVKAVDKEAEAVIRMIADLNIRSWYAGTVQKKDMCRMTVT